jgi:ribosome maturation factor RimP
LDALCTAERMELVHVEYQREAGGKILRLYIDGPGGVTLDDCMNISRQASDVLDVYLENLGPYRLEVSSPGPNRPLGKMTDFERFKGNRVKIKTAQPIDGRKKFSGIMMGTTEGMIKLSINDRTVVIPYQNIVTARLVNSVEK